LREYQRHFFEGSGEFRVVRGVFRGKARNPAGGLGVIVVKEQSLALGSWREDAWVGLQHLQFVLGEAHIARDFGTKRADRVRKSGSTKAGMKFLGDRAAANDFAALQNERLEAAFRQIKRGDE
jgi:hypothetical protein